MKNGLNRFLILLAVFFTAFLVVILVRKAQVGENLLDIFKGRQHAQSLGNDTYTLRKNPAVDRNDIQTLSAINRESAALIRAVVPSVVSIDTSGVRHERRRDSWGRTWLQPRAVQGQGSGVIVSEEGHILTNHHVVKGNPRIQLTMHDGSVHSANIIGAAPTVDIAVLKIDSPGKFIPLKFGDSEKASVGNIVFAIGSPYGLGETVTDGIISAKKRSFSDSQVDLLQTSAAVNPGNSGGPLINIRGEIIGINSRIYSTDKENPGFQGISFAIPSNAALVTMQHILAQGQIERGFLGMALDNVSNTTRRTFNYQQPGGVRIMGLAPNAPAMKAGLLKGDIIIQYNGQAVSDSRQLITLIQQSKVGSKAELKIWRDQKVQSITATLGNAEAFNQSQQHSGNGSSSQIIDKKALLQAIGLEVRPPTNDERQRGAQGVFIKRISPESQLKGKLITGDLIRAINNIPVRDANDFITRLVSSVSRQNTELLIQRGQKSRRLTLAPMRK